MTYCTHCGCHVFYSFFTFLVLANTKRIYNFNEILAKYILSPIVITIIGTLFHRLIWGIGMPEQIRMLSSLIPGFAIWLLFSIQYSIKRQRVKSYGLATFYLFVFLTLILQFIQISLIFLSSICSDIFEIYEYIIDLSHLLHENVFSITNARLFFFNFFLFTLVTLNVLGTCDI